MPSRATVGQKPSSGGCVQIRHSGANSSSPLSTTTSPAPGPPDYDYTYGLGLYGPANLPRAIVDRIAAATLKVLSDPELKAKLAAGGNEAAPSASAGEFARWAEADGKRQKELTEQAGAAIQ